MKVVRVVAVCCILLLLLVVAGCGEEKKESEIVIVGEAVEGKVAVENVSIPDDGLDSAITELEELEGNSS